MKPASEVTALVIDSGIFQHVALRISKEFKQTYYWTPWETAFPHFKDAIIGDGYEGVERVESIEQVKDQCDLFVFPDIGYSDLQLELVSQGKAVWGCRNADELEARRGKFLDVLAKTGMPVPQFEKIKGLTNLRLFLTDHPDQYIKVSTYRGDFETCHFRDMAQDEQMLDAWGVKLGPLREEFYFFCFPPIDTEIEDGIDAWCIDGQWPQTVIHGQECKDSSYLGTFQKFADLPEELRVVNEAFSPILREYGYRSAFSTEVRITKEGESYFIDPTCRFPSPPSQVMCEMIGNLGEVIWGGANGIMVEPEPAAKFGVQAIIKVDRDEWGVFDIPAELGESFNCSFSCKVGNLICVPPDPQGVSEIGWLRATGDTIEEAINRLKELKELLPDGCKCEFQSLAELLKEVHAAQEAGMEFTNQEVPDPAMVIG
jgi:hypothetical protein